MMQEMRMKAPKTAGRIAVYTFDVVFVEVDWEVEVEFVEGVAFVKEEIEDGAGPESVEDGEVMLAGTFKNEASEQEADIMDNGLVLIGEALWEATGCSVVFVASTVVVQAVEECLGSSELNQGQFQRYNCR
jgi:hypothetical protein